MNRSSIFQQVFKRQQGIQAKRKELETKFVELNAHSLSFSGRSCQKLKPPSGVNSIDFEECDNRFLLAGFANGFISLFDTCVKNEDKTLPKVAGMRVPLQKSSCSVDGVQWYPHDTGLFLTLSTDRKISVIDTNELEIAESFKFDCDLSSFNLSKYAKKHSLVAVAGSDKCIYMCDLKTGSKTHSLKGHTASVTCVQWSPRNENILISSSSCGELLIWDARKAKPYLDTLETHRNKAYKGCINSLQFTPDGLHLLSYATDDLIRLWDLTTFSKVEVDYGLVINTNKKVLQMSCSKDLLHNLVYVPSDIFIKAFEIETGRFCGTLSGHFQNVTGCHYASAYQELYTCSADSQIIQWSYLKKPNRNMDPSLLTDNWSGDEDR